MVAVAAWRVHRSAIINTFTTTLDNALLLPSPHRPSSHDDDDDDDGDAARSRCCCRALRNSGVRTRYLLNPLDPYGWRASHHHPSQNSVTRELYVPSATAAEFTYQLRTAISDERKPLPPLPRCPPTHSPALPTRHSRPRLPHRHPSSSYIVRLRHFCRRRTAFARHPPNGHHDAHATLYVYVYPPYPRD